MLFAVARHRLLGQVSKFIVQGGGRIRDQLIIPRISPTYSPAFWPNGCVEMLSESFRFHPSSNQPRISEDAAPLHGIRVLDMTRVLAGPLCTMALGDMGADIIKIERPGVGDETRNWGPPFVGSESCYFLSMNRNKQSVAVDVATSEGSAIIRQLVAKCDVFIHNFLPGKLDGYRLGYSDLREANPRLVHCSISGRKAESDLPKGYGEEGPYKDRGGYDVIASAIGGMMHITGPENGEPCKIGTAMTDISTGLYALGAILAALIRRDRTGIGAKIECNLLSTQIASLVNLGSNYLITGKEPRRLGTAHESIVPYQAFRTADDRYLVVGPGSDKQFSSFCHMIAAPYHKDPKFKTNSTRVENRKELLALLEADFRQRTLADWLETFKSATFPYGPVNSFEQAFADPQVQHQRMVVEMEHETAGPIRVVKSPVKMSEYGMEPRLSPPILGQHTDAVLCELLGYDEGMIGELREKGVIQ